MPVGNRQRKHRPIRLFDPSSVLPRLFLCGADHGARRLAFHKDAGLFRLMMTEGIVLPCGDASCVIGKLCILI